MSATSSNMPRWHTIIGFGSLLSENSAKSTFGTNIRNFRLGHVLNYRRVFTHPASIFFQRGISKLETKEISSLSTQECHGSKFQVSIFELPETQMRNFFEREEEYRIVDAPYEDCLGAQGMTDGTKQLALFVSGEEVFHERYGKYGVHTIWGWTRDSGILPCRVYLRHCVLAVQKLGAEMCEDFLTTTFLADRETTIKRYLADNPSIMDEVPPDHIIGRYSG